MQKLRELFTKWYVKRGWTWGYKPFTDEYGYGCDIETYFDCPWYIKPLLFLFSPSVYTATAIGEQGILAGFEEGFRRADETLIHLRCPECGGEAELWADYNSKLDLNLNSCGCKKCGYRRFCTTKDDFSGAIIRWNDFVKRYKENIVQPLFKKED